jgi:hypothetical protein
MNTLIDTPKKAHHDAGQIVIEMNSGEVIRFPVSDSSRLRNGSDAELSEIEISPFGLHWPRLDEDLSIRGLLKGRHPEETK